MRTLAGQRSRRRSSRIVGMVLALVGIVLRTPALCDEDWITATAGQESQLVDDGTTQTLRIAMRLEVDVSNVSLSVIAVRLNDVLRPELLQGFTVTSTLTRTGAGSQTIELKVDTNLASRCGTYEVWIEASAANHSAEILKISVEHPPASLRPPAKLMMEIVRDAMGADSFTATPLALEVTSYDSRVSDLVLGSIRYPAAAEPVTGTLELTTELAPINAGETHEAVPWTLTSGTFPLGVTEGEADIRAPQLKDPVVVHLSIKSRRSLVWLWVATFLGLVLGWALKSWLENFLQLLRARREGMRVLDVIDEQLRRYGDTTFKAELRICREELTEAVRGRNTAAVTEKATTAQTKLNEELTKLQERQQTLRNSINAWLKAVGAQRELPPALQECCQRATGDLRQAAVTLNSDFTSAQATVAQVTTRLLQELTNESERWKQSTHDALGEVVDPKRLSLPNLVADRVSAAAKPIGEDLAAIDTGPADAEGARALLETVDRLRRQLLISVIERADAMLSVAANRITQTLEDADAMPAALREEIRAAANAAHDALTRGSVEERLAALAPGATRELNALDETFRKVIESVRIGDPATKNQIEQQVSERDYEGAARRAAEAKKAADSEKDEKLNKRVAEASATVPAKSEPVGPLAFRLRWFDSRARWVDLVGPDHIMSAAEVRLTAAQTAKQIWLVQAAQSAIVGALFLAVAHLTYAEKYIGTFPELAGIFFWAFSLDVTVARLIEAAKGLGAPATDR